MKNFESWTGDLSEVMPRVSEVALGENELKLLLLNARVALALPRDKGVAKEVLGLYRPMKFKARLAAGALSGLIRSGLHHYLGRNIKEGNSPEISWLRNCNEIGFLGCNPNHGVRLVILSSYSGGELKVTKLAIGGNHGLLRDEAEKLKRFAKEYGGIPRVEGLEEGRDWTAFGMKFLAEPGPPRMRGNEIVPLLEKWRSQETVQLGSIPWLAQVLDGVSAPLRLKLGGLMLKKSVFHGDFAPWNLRRDEEELVAVDWEWGRLDGVAGLDLGYGLISEDHLVGGLSGESLVRSVWSKARAPLISQFLKESGWADLKLWLFFIFLLNRSRFADDLHDEMILFDRLDASCHSISNLSLDSQ